MVVDASVWVAVFRTGDVHHETALAFLEAALARGTVLNVPTLALVEVAGVFARQLTAALAKRTVHKLMAYPGLQRHSLDDGLADKAWAVAAHCRLRGGDAVYVALASQLRVPLITLDREILGRAKAGVRALTPDEWLRSPLARSRQ
jgi:predicted nucleic acid-binding protein